MNTLRDRFLKKIDVGDDCWIWTGHLNNKGYGMMWVRNMVPQLAHRISYLLYVGPIPIGKCVLHRCDNPKCIRPDHLFIGTKRENSRDMASKGRHRIPGLRGEEVHHSKLTAKQVISMRELFEGQVTHHALHKVLAEKYGVSPSTINDALRGKSWKSLLTNVFS